MTATPPVPTQPLGAGLSQEEVTQMWMSRITEELSSYLVCSKYKVGLNKIKKLIQAIAKGALRWPYKVGANPQT